MPSDHPLPEYTKMVMRLWGNHIAGPIAGALAVILPVVGLACHSSATLTICLGVAPLLLAVVLIWPAQYQAWKQEHVIRHRCEDELTSHADMRGTITIHVNGSSTDNPPGTSMSVYIEVANHGRARCEVCKVKFVIDHPTLKLPDDDSYVNLRNIHDVGHGEIIRDVQGCILYGVSVQQLSESKIKALLVDGLGMEHQNTVTNVTYAAGVL